MSQDTATGAHGLIHQAAFYDCDEQFLAIVASFVRGGVDAGEPTVVALDDRHIELIRSASAASPHLSFVSGMHDRPACVLKSLDKVLRGYLAAGARQIRIVAEVPHPGVGVPWEWWARYEATVNHAFARFPLWALCPYDRRVTPAEVLSDVAQTHPYLASSDGRRVINDRYTDPRAFLAQGRSPRADPLEISSPVLELVNPAASAARRAVLQAARASHLSAGDVEDLVIAVSETVTNAICHGRPPVGLRLWVARDRIVVTVTDQGSGPSDPFAGLLPAPKAPAGGLGLWLTHQLCSLVTFDHREDGFTIRLIAGNPRP
jgi:anti-sigma regulatory factor (Ser/Thr protein kinase)